MVFVDGAIPGEVVIAEVVETRNDFRRAVVIDVVEASSDRVAPPCPNVAKGCGGCGWQHVGVARQRALKEDIVRDALVRIAKVAPDALPTIASVGLPSEGFRTTVRVAVEGGRARYHQARSPGLVDATGCLIAHPLLLDLIDGGCFGDAEEAVIRVGVASGERAVLLRPSARGARLPADVSVVDATAKPGPMQGVVRERVRERDLAVSIRSFFQSSPLAAEALVGEVLRALGGTAEGVATFADLYAGVGLFAGAVAEAFGAIGVAVERSRSAVADARQNLADVDVRIVPSEVGRWRAERVDAVIADPARPGLGKPGAAAVARSDAGLVVLISCDPASFARDVRLLRDARLELEAVSLVDAFPHTPHMEVVSTFQRLAK